jgi:acyl-CoA synthetase (AMP-forming)/AMP-acid ligase II
MNLREFFEQQVVRNREKVYLYFQDQGVTYGALDQKVNQVANGFLE